MPKLNADLNLHSSWEAISTSQEGRLLCTIQDSVALVGISVDDREICKNKKHSIPLGCKDFVSEVSVELIVPLSN